MTSFSDLSPSEQSEVIHIFNTEFRGCHIYSDGENLWFLAKGPLAGPEELLQGEFQALAPRVTTAMAEFKIQLNVALNEHLYACTSVNLDALRSLNLGYAATYFSSSTHTPNLFHRMSLFSMQRQNTTTDSDSERYDEVTIPSIGR